jgi:aryl-alcohol dehydrogenase-like predicted oxidoreductase
MLERGVEREVLPYCRAHALGFVPDLPPAGGFVTGKYKRGQPAPPGSRGESNCYVQGYMTERNYDILEQLSAWAGERGRGMNELAHAWLLVQPQVSSVTSGATRVEHVQSNAKAADWHLGAQQLAEINAVLDTSGGSQ